MQLPVLNLPANNNPSRITNLQDKISQIQKQKAETEAYEQLSPKSKLRSEFQAKYILQHPEPENPQ